MQIIESKPLNPVWLKASVIGSTWASVEIILGSFLHNLRVPFSGTILSFISVWIIISFLQIWKEKGLALRAGIVCAMLKSISPSAIILGPMIGIISEALLVEIMVFIFGMNIIGFTIGGAFAVLSSIIHKAVSLLFIYGFNLVKILGDLYKWSVKQIHLEKLSPTYLLYVIVAIYIVAGITAAIGGYITGRKYLRKKVGKGDNEEIRLQPVESSISNSGEQKYSAYLLLLHIIIVTAALLLLNSKYVIPSLVLSVLYVAACVFYYRNSLKRLKKFSFWLGFAIVTFSAAFLWNGFSGGAFFSTEGLMIGLMMNVRAVLMIIGFAAISTELKNPVIKSLLYSKGLDSLYQATGLAFSALPYFISGISGSGKSKKYFLSRSENNIYSLAERLLEQMKSEHQGKAGIIIISGETHSGKTTMAKELITLLQNEGYKAGGFLSLAVFENKERVGYNMVDISSGISVGLCSVREQDTKTRIGRYFFNEEAISNGNQILKKESEGGKDILVIDEIGPLELANKGWSKGLDILCQSGSVLQLWITRKNTLEKAIRRWNNGTVYIFYPEQDSTADISAKIIELLWHKKASPPPVN